MKFLVNIQQKEYSKYIFRLEFQIKLELHTTEFNGLYLNNYIFNNRNYSLMIKIVL